MSAEVVVLERAVRSERGTVSVRRDGGVVRVKWYCGEQYGFVITQVKTLVRTIDGARGHWVACRHMAGGIVYAQVQDGQLHANTARVAAAGSVSWPLLRQLLLEAAE